MDVGALKLPNNMRRQFLLLIIQWMSEYNNDEVVYQDPNYVEPIYEDEDEDEGKKKKLALVLLLLLAIILLGGVFLWLNGTVDKDANSLERELAAENGFLPGMSDEDIQAKLNEIIDKSMLNISINPTPIYENGKVEGNIRIENTPNNHYAFVVEIILSDSGESIMKTGVIDPGQFVENRKLDVNLSAGEYDCMAFFTAYDLETNAEIGQTATTIMITVKN